MNRDDALCLFGWVCRTTGLRIHLAGRIRPKSLGCPKARDGRALFWKHVHFSVDSGIAASDWAPSKGQRKKWLWQLGSQIALTVPLNFLLVGVATLYRETWFFPAVMIVVGAHYLPFITLYGMKMFGILAALLVVGGALLAAYGPSIFSLGGWLTAVALIIFAFLGRAIVRKEEQQNTVTTL